MKLADGLILNTNLRDYKIPDATNMPDNKNFKCFMVPVPHKDGPYGGKGTGETQITP